MEIQELQNEKFKRITHDFMGAVKPFLVEEFRKDFPVCSFLMTYWADDSTFDKVEPVLFYLYERVRDLPLEPDGVMSDKNSLFEACLWTGFEAMQLTFTGLYYLRTPLKEREVLLGHLKLMSFLSGLFAPYVQAASRLAVVSYAGSFYDFKATLEDWMENTLCADAGFIEGHIPRYGLWDQFASEMTDDLMSMIENPLGDHSLVAAFRSLLNQDFGELFLANRDLFRVLAAAENKVIRRFAKQKNRTSVSDLCNRSHYLLAYALTSFLDSLDQTGLIRHGDLVVRKGSVFFNGIDIFREVAQIMNDVVGETLWKENDVRASGIRGAFLSRDLDDDDYLVLGSLGHEEMDDFVKLDHPLRFVAVGSHCGSLVRSEPDYFADPTEAFIEEATDLPG